MNKELGLSLTPEQQRALRLLGMTVLLVLLSACGFEGQQPQPGVAAMPPGGVVRQGESPEVGATPTPDAETASAGAAEERAIPPRTCRAALRPVRAVAGEEGFEELVEEGPYSPKIPQGSTVELLFWPEGKREQSRVVVSWDGFTLRAATESLEVASGDWQEAGEVVASNQREQLLVESFADPEEGGCRYFFVLQPSLYGPGVYDAFMVNEWQGP